MSTLLFQIVTSRREDFNHTAGILVICCALLLAGCGGEQRDTGAQPGSPPRTVDEAGPVHVHGLGVNPGDGSLFIATHTGMFRAPQGQTRAERVGKSFQDTMGFAVVGPDRFLGSGHPDIRDDLPPFLGLIRSDDAGRTWQPVSLLGKRDFHVLEAAGRRVYGYGFDFETRKPGFLASGDGGESWQQRAVPEPLISLAIHPGDPDKLVASGRRSVFRSEDGGRSWSRIDAPAGLLAWSGGLVIVDADGVVHSARPAGSAATLVGKIGGRPAALESDPDSGLYVALHDGTVKRSDDGGRTWTLRSAP